MKHNKLLSVVLCGVFALLCISAPLESAAVVSPEIQSLSDLSETAVMVNENQLEYTLIGNPSRAVINKYTGSDTRIILPETVDGYPLANISPTAFGEYTALEYIKLPANAWSVSSKLFAKCTSLKYIDVHKDNPKMVSVDGVVFNKNMTTILAFPNGVGGSYKIPDGVVSIGAKAFYECTYLSEVIMPNSVEAVYNEAFYRCMELDNVHMSNNLTSIDDRAFSYCDDLTALHLPFSLSYIGTDAFLGYIASGRDHKVYFLTDGLYYVPGTYAEEYVNGLHLPSEVKHPIDCKITDYETGVTIIDHLKILPNTGKLDLKVTVLPADDYAPLLPGSFSKLYCYNISLTNDGVEIPLSDNLIIRFNGIDEDTILSTARVFRINGDDVTEYMRTPNAPFVGASTKKLGTYIVGTNNDFSLKGDLNGDGIVSSYDAMFALYIAAGITDNTTAEQIKNADFNGDGKVKTNDALQILRKAADLI